MMMKTIKLILATIVVISLVIILKWGLVTNDHKKPLNSNACVTEEGSSVTFIMGSDKPNTNDFYKNATYYYHLHPIDKTDFVILSCKSLEDVLDFLTLQSDHTYFETINIVCHGNPWQGLSMPIANNLPRASLPNLDAAFKKNWINPLCTDAVDQHSKINIISCGVGQNKEISDIIKKIFTCPKTKTSPMINIETNYVNFTDKLDKKRSEFYFVASKYDYNDPGILASKLSNKYKTIALNWQKAYRNEHRNSENEPYKHHFRMLVEWKIGFNEGTEIPELKKDADILNWLKIQPAAMGELQQMQLKPEDFMWHCLKVTDQPNTIKIKGYGNVEGVMIDLPNVANVQNIANLY
ncbi:MAG: hypothetical protein IPJ13_00445 [Saprospiraceae bacterium]|nr:hypothetical protein [Saprospiraceae bacterium]